MVEIKNQACFLKFAWAEINRNNSRNQEILYAASKSVRPLKSAPKLYTRYYTVLPYKEIAIFILISSDYHQKFHF